MHGVDIVEDNEWWGWVQCIKEVIGKLRIGVWIGNQTRKCSDGEFKVAF